jgi:DeoR/GlpR family transcriptional regulator of sugar metabolism
MKQGKQEKILDRRRQLLELILQKGKDVEISVLARILKVKRDTIYRDLEALEDAEIIHRTPLGIEVIRAV